MRNRQFLPEKKIENSIKKYALLELAKVLKNISQACEIVGLSRDTYYRAYKTYTAKNIRQNNLNDNESRSRNFSQQTLQRKKEVEELVLDVAEKNPDLSKRSIAKIIQERGVFVSASAVYNILKKNLSPNDSSIVRFEKKHIS